MKIGIRIRKHEADNMRKNKKRQVETGTKCSYKKNVYCFIELGKKSSC